MKRYTIHYSSPLPQTLTKPSHLTHPHLPTPSHLSLAVIFSFTPPPSPVPGHALSHLHLPHPSPTPTFTSPTLTCPWPSSFPSISPEEKVRARPKSPMTQVPLDFTRMFLLFRSRWAMDGFTVTLLITISLWRWARPLEAEIARSQRDWRSRTWVLR